LKRRLAATVDNAAEEPVPRVVAGERSVSLLTPAYT